jgi:hypothetical protein
MIKLTRDRTAVHKDFTGAPLVSKLTALVDARIRLADAIEFTGAIGDWKKAKKALKSETHGKCAYCESDTEKVAHGDVEEPVLIFVCEA